MLAAACVGTDDVACAAVVVGVNKKDIVLVPVDVGVWAAVRVGTEVAGTRVAVGSVFLAIVIVTRSGTTDTSRLALFLRPVT